MQVQVLGTEETWQTPSLLLATVKGGDGRAIFSQVSAFFNLEITLPFMNYIVLSIWY